MKAVLELIITVLTVLRLIATLIISVYVANQLGLNGLVWYSFVFLFYITVTRIITRLGGDQKKAKEELNHDIDELNELYDE